MKLKRSILIIAETIEHKFYRLLNVEGEDTEICTSASASKVLEDCDPQLVVIDAGSDTERGLGLVRSIKEKCTSIPIVFVAEENSEHLAGKSLAAGARLFRSKPLSIIELGDSIATLLTLKRSSREKRTALSADKHCIPEQTHIHQVSANDKPLPVLRTISYMRNNLSADITLERLAAEAHMSKYHFCRLFKKHCAMTPMEFVSCLRITRARELLLREDLNISMVALEVGYNDASTFIRHFKKLTGLRPSDYKKSSNKMPAQPHG